MSKIQTSFYAIIPADVRYSDIPPNAKLLYGEITALCNKEGFCWATNSYFAQLYKVAPTTISDWIRKLRDKGFVDYEILNKTKRKIYLTLREKPKGVSGKAEGGVSGKAEHNNTSINNTTNNAAKAAPWGLEKEIEKLQTDKREHIRIIGLYIEAKNYRPENNDQVQSIIKRNARAAMLLKGYDWKRLVGTMAALRKKADFTWKLETVGKFIDDPREIDKLPNVKNKNL